MIIMTRDHLRLSADAHPELLLILVGEDPSLDFWSPGFDGGQGEPVPRAFFLLLLNRTGLCAEAHLR